MIAQAVMSPMLRGQEYGALLNNALQDYVRWIVQHSISEDCDRLKLLEEKIPARLAAKYSLILARGAIAPHVHLHLIDFFK